MKNQSIRKYLQQARAQNHEGMLNADGRFDDDMQFTGGEDFFPANGNGNGRGMRKPSSQPYIITVTSSTGAAVSDFDLLGAFEYVDGGTGSWSSGQLTVSNIVISAGIPGTTYREFLHQTQTNPFTIGLTYIESSTSGQILETFQVITKDSNGNEAKKVLVPVKDPYQNQTDVLAVTQGYRIDGYTKIRVNEIKANATVKFYLYPADNINLARGLSGQAVSEQFDDPGIVREQVKVVNNGGGRRVSSRLG